MSDDEVERPAIVAPPTGADASEMKDLFGSDSDSDDDLKGE
jgi:hypothetical protein